jgi:hypothetical protein
VIKKGRKNALFLRSSDRKETFLKILEIKNFSSQIAAVIPPIRVGNVEAATQS